MYYYPTFNKTESLININCEAQEEEVLISESTYNQSFTNAEQSAGMVCISQINIINLN